ncbi:hypothetical protein M427DRAFT_155236 [Gonapodya prolifera JEL478]|uniref:Thioesterase/thiol ester dehydrase-isomerase n=1 Tax=Gonapodya prolifera (strain JEL478) TaxID=1344416 RepID=A0A139AG48_GONPJ|nr:hypothetical protein M427DRAFT_155236 [Gonapodya prolifera JEL478]|eukprot:KXS15781.1 hypothetical protein M427DRAFT_155236 [Gonapodya prolifera JEL478]
MEAHSPPEHRDGATNQGAAPLVSDRRGGPFARALEMKFRKGITLNSFPELGGDQVTACWEGWIDDQFLTGIAPFGGYVLGIALHAARLEVRRRGIERRFPEPVSLSANLLEAGRSDAFLAVVTPVRIGGRFAVFDVAIRQAPLPKASAAGSTTWITLLTAKITMSDIASERGTTTILSDDGKTPVDHPFLPSALHSPPGATRFGLGLPRLADALPLEPKTMWKGHYKSPRTGKFFHQFFDVRHQKYEEEDIVDLPMGAEWCKWVRWNSGDVQDIPSMAFWGDMSMSPIIINHIFGPKSQGRERQWSPTMDFALQIRRLPSPDMEWVLVRSKAPYLTNGRKCLDIEMWDEQGNLLAITRQMQGTVVVSAQRQARTVEANAAGLQSLKTKRSNGDTGSGSSVPAKI